jgi:hypothetical protein
MPHVYGTLCIYWWTESFNINHFLNLAVKIGVVDFLVDVCIWCTDPFRSRALDEEQSVADGRCSVRHKISAAKTPPCQTVDFIEATTRTPQPTRSPTSRNHSKSPFDESVVAVLGAIVQHAPVSMRATSVASFVLFRADWPWSQGRQPSSHF